ncbi:MAG TPA: hypothetical protein VJ045_12640 [Hyphomicrobiaceae bacterium]|nr:hypothetical protein [Hyphomicrobiaceae bacterium]
MMKKIVPWLVVTAVLLFAPVAQTPARALTGLEAGAVSVDGVTEVRHRGHGGLRIHRHGMRFGKHHGRRFAFKHHGFARHRFHRHRHFRYRPRIWIGYPYYYYGGYYGDCYWLKVKAIRTGSRYWWRRYHECVGW